MLVVGDRPHDDVLAQLGGVAHHGGARRAARLGADLRAEDGCGTAASALVDLLARQRV